MPVTFFSVVHASRFVFLAFSTNCLGWRTPCVYCRYSVTDEIHSRRLFSKVRVQKFSLHVFCAM